MRAPTPRFLIGFDRLFPGAGDHPLEVNYRCPAALVVEQAADLLSLQPAPWVAKAVRLPVPAGVTRPRRRARP